MGLSLFSQFHLSALTLHLKKEKKQKQKNCESRLLEFYTKRSILTSTYPSRQLFVRRISRWNECMPMLLNVYPQFIISLRPNTGLVFPAKTQRLQDSNPFICHIMLARTVLVQLVLITLPFGPPVTKRIDRSFD
jgi:hypothetical protein